MYTVPVAATPAGVLFVLAVTSRACGGADVAVTYYDECWWRLSWSKKVLFTIVSAGGCL
jgi:hypothetical protein